MADLVGTLVLVSTKTHYAARFVNESDGTGESAVVKIDKSTLTDLHGREPRAIDICSIEFQVNGFNYITLLWDHGTDKRIAVLKGNGYFSWEEQGGLLDPNLNDSTGDVLLTTDGAIDGASYNITIEARLRPND